MVRVYAAKIPGKELSRSEQSEWAYRLLDRTLKEMYPGVCTPVFVEKDVAGKPFLRDYPDIHISVSHSGCFVVCAVGNKPVGADVEVWKKRENPERMMKKFHPRERALFEKLKEEQRQRTFYGLWVLKESFLKAEGRGLRIPLDSFCMEPVCDAGGKPVWNDIGRVEQVLNDRNYYFRLYPVSGEAVSLAVCSEETEFAKKPVWLTFPEEFSETEEQVRTK